MQQTNVDVAPVASREEGQNKADDEHAASVVAAAMAHEVALDTIRPCGWDKQCRRGGSPSRRILGKSDTEHSH